MQAGRKTLYFYVWDITWWCFLLPQTKCPWLQRWTIGRGEKDGIYCCDNILTRINIAFFMRFGQACGRFVLHPHILGITPLGQNAFVSFDEEVIPYCPSCAFDACPQTFYSVHRWSEWHHASLHQLLGSDVDCSLGRKSWPSSFHYDDLESIHLVEDSRPLSLSPPPDQISTDSEALPLLTHIMMHHVLELIHTRQACCTAVELKQSCDVPCGSIDMENQYLLNQ